MQDWADSTSLFETYSNFADCARAAAEWDLDPATARLTTPTLALRPESKGAAQAADRSQRVSACAQVMVKWNSSTVPAIILAKGVTSYSSPATVSPCLGLLAHPTVCKYTLCHILAVQYLEWIVMAKWVAY